MKLNPEILNEKKLTEGTYKFVIKKASEALSKEKGIPMIKLVLDVDGVTVYDNLLETNQFKIKKLLDALDKLDAFKRGELQPTELEGAIGECAITLEDSDKYGKTPRVSGYFRASASTDFDLF